MTPEKSETEPPNPADALRALWPAHPTLNEIAAREAEGWRYVRFGLGMGWLKDCTFYIGDEYIGCSDDLPRIGREDQPQ